MTFAEVFADRQLMFWIIIICGLIAMSIGLAVNHIQHYLKWDRYWREKNAGRNPITPKRGPWDGDKMTETALAYFIYSHFKIPPEEWKEHFSYDQVRFKRRLRTPVLRAYQCIYNSLTYRG